MVMYVNNTAAKIVVVAGRYGESVLRSLLVGTTVLSHSDTTFSNRSARANSEVPVCETWNKKLSPNQKLRV